MALIRKNLLKISQIESSSKLSRIFNLSFSSRSSETEEEDKDKDRDNMQRMGHKLSEGGDDSSIETNIKRDKGRYNDEETVMKSPEDEDELKDKLEHCPGGKPVDEDRNLDVNWRPIDEKKSV